MSNGDRTLSFPSEYSNDLQSAAPVALPVQLISGAGTLEFLIVILWFSQHAVGNETKTLQKTLPLLIGGLPTNCGQPRPFRHILALSWFTQGMNRLNGALVFRLHQRT